MSKIDLSSFPPLVPSAAPIDRPKTVWIAIPKISRKQVELSSSVRFAGLWLSRWRAFGDEFFSTYTCAWLVDVIDRSISPNPWKEAETFFHWFTDELKLYNFGNQFLEAFDIAATIYIQKTVEIFYEFRTSRPQVDDVDLFKAHWFITLQDPPNANTTVELAFQMVQSGRRNVSAMVEELWKEIVLNLSPFEEKLWRDLDQIGGWTENMKSGTCRKMDQAMRTLIS